MELMTLLMLLRMFLKTKLSKLTHNGRQHTQAGNK